MQEHTVYMDSKLTLSGDSLNLNQKHRHATIKKQAMMFSCAGFLLVLLLGLPFVYFKAIDLSWPGWLLAMTLNIAVWSFFWLLIHYELDQYLFFDPHFLLIPAAAAGLLICLLVYLVPETRVLVLGGWFTVLLFGSGLLGFVEGMALSVFMAIAHLATIYLLIQRGEPLSMAYEVGVMLPLMIFWTFCSVVLERDKRNRNENLDLRKQLSEMAFNDSLTGLPNRRAFMQLLERESAYCERSQIPCCLAMLDIDLFKQVNDQLGHESGDHVLVEVAQIIRHGIRVEDTAARLGGDEFVIFMRESYVHKAALMVERIRIDVEQKMADLYSETDIQVSLSIGVAVWLPGLELSDVLQQADMALYQAKESGRNQVFYQAESDVSGSHEKRGHRVREEAV